MSWFELFATHRDPAFHASRQVAGRARARSSRPGYAGRPVRRLLYYIPHDKYTAAGRPRAGGRRRETRGPVIGGGASTTTEKQKIKPKNKQTLKTRPPSIPFSLHSHRPCPRGRGFRFVAARSGETSDTAYFSSARMVVLEGVYSSAAASGEDSQRARRAGAQASRDSDSESCVSLEGDLRSGEETFLGRLPSSRRRPTPSSGWQ